MLKGVIHAYWFVALIFVIALFLRTYQLSEYPVGLHGDEASIGYNAFSLLKTLHDQNGNFLPIAIDQFGDFRPAGYHYLDIPFVAIMGLNEFSVRLPAAIFGSLSVIVIYFFVLELFKSRLIAGTSALLLAILPWDINISRASSEAVIATFFVLLGALCYVRFVKSKNYSYPLILLSGIFLVISFFFYHAHRYFVPLLFPLIVFCACFSYHASKKKVLSSLILIALLFIAVFAFLFVGKGTGRVSEVGLLSIPGGTANLKQAMDEEGTLNPLINRSYNNKLFYYGRFFINFYSQHLSGDFLFVNNGFPVRYRIPFTGNLYIIMAPFLLIGFAKLLSEGIFSRKYIFLIPVAWLLLAPIPAGLTWEDLPNVIRASLLIPSIVIVAAYGFGVTLQIVQQKNIRRLILAFCFVVLLHNFLYFYHNYYWRLKVHEPWHRSTAVKELLFQVDQVGNGKKIVMTTEKNNNLIFYLFYNKYDPSKFQGLGSPREHDGLEIENIKYTYSPCPISGGQDEIALGNYNMIYVNKDDCQLPKNAEVLQTVRMPDGVPAYKIIKLNQISE